LRVLLHYFCFFTSTSPTHIYTLSLHDALPIWRLHARIRKTRYMHKMRCLLINRRSLLLALRLLWKTPIFPSNSRFPRLCATRARSEERFSRNAETDLVCRLLLEKKKRTTATRP